MELFNTLESFGLTREVLQLLIIGVGATILIGMVWQLLVIGAGIVFVVLVFAPDGITKTGPNAWAETKIEQLEKQRKKDFMSDCIRLGDSEVKCNSIWNEGVKND